MMKKGNTLEGRKEMWRWMKTAFDKADANHDEKLDQDEYMVLGKMMMDMMKKKMCANCEECKKLNECEEGVEGKEEGADCKGECKCCEGCSKSCGEKMNCMTPEHMKKHHAACDLNNDGFVCFREIKIFHRLKTEYCMSKCDDMSKCKVLEYDDTFY